jgi:hypothetical protein
MDVYVVAQGPIVRLMNAIDQAIWRVVQSWTTGSKAIDAFISRPLSFAVRSIGFVICLFLWPLVLYQALSQSNDDLLARSQRDLSEFKGGERAIEVDKVILVDAWKLFLIQTLSTCMAIAAISGLNAGTSH